MAYYNKFPMLLMPQVPASAVFTHEAVLTGNSASYNFTNVALGDEHPTRKIVAFFSTYRNAAVTQSSLTFNGVAMTPLAVSVAGTLTIGAYIIDAPIGALASIVTSQSPDAGAGHLAAFACYNLKSSTPVDTDVQMTSGSIPSVSSTVDVVNGGLTLSVAATRQNNRTFTWSGTANPILAFGRSSVSGVGAVGGAIQHYQQSLAGLVSTATGDLNLSGLSGICTISMK